MSYFNKLMFQASDMVIWTSFDSHHLVIFIYMIPM